MNAVLPCLLGFALGLGLGVGETLYQAETRYHDGEPRQVVVWVYKSQVVETPVWQRCLMVGLGCGLLGGAAGHRLGAGGRLLPALVGAVLLLGLGRYVESLLPDTHGRAGLRARSSADLFYCLLGAAAGAEASLRVQAQRRARG